MLIHKSLLIIYYVHMYHHNTLFHCMTNYALRLSILNSTHCIYSTRIYAHSSTKAYFERYSDYDMNFDCCVS